MLPRLSGDEDRVFKPYPLSEVTILGMGNSVSSWLQQEYQRSQPRPDNHQVWVINNGARVLRHDVVFNMHDLETYASENPGSDYINFHKEHSKPVVAVKAIPGIDNIYEYPLADVVKEFGETYFSTGVAYLIAFALLCEVEKINIFGCDFNYTGIADYEMGRCCLEFWLGYCRAKGVVIAIPPKSTLCDFKHRMTGKGLQGNGGFYGYAEEQPVISPDENGKAEVVGFNTAPASFDEVEDAVQTIQNEKATP